MNPEVIRPTGRAFDGGDQRAPLRLGLLKAKQYGPGQTAGRFYPMACVALEITQRCNLDCTLCYLSDAAEMAHDVPMPVLLGRLDMVKSHYGPGTSVQISGGDPTLRKLDDLKVLCREIRARGMRSCLMTNGIKATRPFLSSLAKAGLDDVAFHIDLSQERSGYPTEESLNELRRDYIDRARGLGLRILFNTTVFNENLSEIPIIMRFFKTHAADITLVSFQLQAETGRGVLRERPDEVSQHSVMAAISEGAGTSLTFDTTMVGHADCNRYESVLVAGDAAVSAVKDKRLVHEVMQAMEDCEKRTDGYTDVFPTAIRTFLKKPYLALRTAAYFARQLWDLKSGLLQSRGRVHRFAVMVHNFMDAEQLDEERCRACTFMVLTEDGPLSMCVHNARRDQHLFRPARIATKDGEKWWSASTGEMTDTPDCTSPKPAPFKLLKGRLRAKAAMQRRNDTPSGKRKEHQE